MEILTYDEWRSKIRVNVSEGVEEDMLALHGVDVHSEIDVAMRHEYNLYVDAISKNNK